MLSLDFGWQWSSRLPYLQRTHIQSEDEWSTEVSCQGCTQKMSRISALCLFHQGEIYLLYWSFQYFLPFCFPIDTLHTNFGIRNCILKWWIASTSNIWGGISNNSNTHDDNFSFDVGLGPFRWLSECDGQWTVVLNGNFVLLQRLFLQQ